MSSIKGKVEAVNRKKGKDFEGIIVKANGEDQWFNAKKENNILPNEINEGDKVAIETTENWQDDFYNIENIHIMESGASEDGSSRGSDRQKSSPMGESTGSDNFIPKDERIQRQVALKEACETARQSGNLQEELRDGNHEELVNKLANAYYGILQNIGGDQ